MMIRDTVLFLGHPVVSLRMSFGNNNNNNNKHICNTPIGRTFRGAGGSRLCVLVIVGFNEIKMF